MHVFSFDGNLFLLHQVEISMQLSIRELVKQ